MAGLIGGVLFANLFGKNYLNQTGILSDYFLSKYKYMEIDYGNLFFYILGKRSVGILFLWIMGVTVLGCPAVWLYLVWYGFSAGMILSMSVMKFGVKAVSYTHLDVYKRQEFRRGRFNAVSCLRKRDGARLFTKRSTDGMGQSTT